MKRVGYGTLAASLLVAFSARAEGVHEVEELLEQSVVSSASLASEVSTTAPAVTVVITAEDLRRFGVQSLDEAINLLGSGMSVGSGELSARGVLFTGDYNDHVLLLIDGHVANDPWSGTSYFGRASGVPLEMVDHIELMLGPSSVVYGSSAMLGVVNVITKAAKDFSGLRLVGELGASAPQNAAGSVRAPSAWPSDSGFGYRLAAGYGAETHWLGAPLELVMGAEYHHAELPRHEYAQQNYGADSVTGEPANLGRNTLPGYWGGKPPQRFPSDTPAAYAKLSWKNFELLARGVLWRRSYPMSNADFGDTGSYEREHWLSLELRHSLSLSSRTTLRTRLWGDRYVYEQLLHTSAAENCLDGQLAGCTYEYGGGASWFGLELQLAHDWLADGTQRSQLGVQAQLQRVDAATDYVDSTSGAKTRDVGDYARIERVFAAYFQHTATPLAWLWLNAGARFDSSTRGTALSPRAALTVTPWSSGALKLIYAEAFRSPNAYESYYEDAFTLASVLRPEKVRGFELGFEQRFGAQRLSLSAFYNHWSDMIESRELSSAELDAAIQSGRLRAGTTYATTLNNSNTIESLGYSMAWNGALARRLSYAVSLTSAIARAQQADGSKLELRAAPRFFGNARLAYELPLALPTTLALAAHWVGQRPSNAVRESGFAEPLHSSGLFSLRATWSGELPGLRAVSYRLSGSYLAGARPSPYLIGPVRFASEAEPSAHYELLDRLNAFVGLEWHAL